VAVHDMAILLFENLFSQNAIIWVYNFLCSAINYHTIRT